MGSCSSLYSLALFYLFNPLFPIASSPHIHPHPKTNNLTSAIYRKSDAVYPHSNQPILLAMSQKHLVSTATTKQHSNKKNRKSLRKHVKHHRNNTSTTGITRPSNISPYTNIRHDQSLSSSGPLSPLLCQSSSIPPCS